MKFSFALILVLIVACQAMPNATQASPLLDRVEAGQATTVVTIGTSLTANGVWPGELEAWLKGQSTNPGGVNLINRGVSGSASGHPTASLSGLDTQVPLALADNPDAVFIEFSMNDAVQDPGRGYNLSVADSKNNLLNMIGQFQTQNPGVIIILQTMNNVTGSAAALRPDLNNYYEAVRQVAADEGLLLIDHQPAWTDLLNNDPSTWNAYVPGGLHPTAAGQQAVTMPGIIAALQVPEPTSLALLSLGGLIVLRRCR